MLGFRLLAIRNNIFQYTFLQSGLCSWSISPSRLLATIKIVQDNLQDLSELLATPLNPTSVYLTNLINIRSMGGNGNFKIRDPSSGFQSIKIQDRSSRLRLSGHVVESFLL